MNKIKAKEIKVAAHVIGLSNGHHHDASGVSLLTQSHGTSQLHGPVRSSMTAERRQPPQRTARLIDEATSRTSLSYSPRPPEGFTGTR